MTSELKTCNYCGAEVPCTDDACPMNTRAVPDVPELVRLCPDVTSAGHPYIRPDKDGKYVTYSQAAEIIAADRAEIERLRHLIDGDDCPDPDKIDALFRRAEAAEAELAQIKAQEPVAWMHPDAGWTDVCKVKVSNHCKKGIKPTPLYASPAPTEDLKTKLSRYEQALGDIAAFKEKDGTDAATTQWNRAGVYAATIARAALNPSEPRS